MLSSKSISTFFSLAINLCLSSAAFAADAKPYIEVGPAWTDAEVSNDSLHLSGLVRAGVEVTSWAAFEIEGIWGLDTVKDVRTNDDEFEGGLDHQFGGYVRLGLPIDDQFLPYVRVGYATAQTSIIRRRIGNGTSDIREREDSFSGPSFGFGVQGFFGENRNNGVRLDLIGLLANGDEDEFFDLLDGTSNISVTYVRRF